MKLKLDCRSDILYCQSYTCLKPTSVSHDIILFSKVPVISFNLSISVLSTEIYDS